MIASSTIGICVVSHGSFTAMNGTIGAKVIHLKSEMTKQLSAILTPSEVSMKEIRFFYRALTSHQNLVIELNANTRLPIHCVLLHQQPLIKLRSWSGMRSLQIPT